MQSNRECAGLARSGGVGTPWPRGVFSQLRLVHEPAPILEQEDDDAYRQDEKQDHPLDEGAQESQGAAGSLILRSGLERQGWG